MEQRESPCLGPFTNQVLWDNRAENGVISMCFGVVCKKTVQLKQVMIKGAQILWEPWELHTSICLLVSYNPALFPKAQSAGRRLLPRKLVVPSWGILGHCQGPSWTQEHFAKDTQQNHWKQNHRNCSGGCIKTPLWTWKETLWGLWERIRKGVISGAEAEC